MSPTMTAGAGVIAALIAGVLIQSLAVGTTYPLLGIALWQDVPGLWNGVNAAATGLGLLLGSIVTPLCGRRFGAGSTALCGAVLMSASLAALALTRDFWTLFAIRLLLGCGANMIFVVAETALNVFASPGRRGRVMGLYAAAGAFGFTVGPGIVAVMPDRPAALLLGCAAVTALAVLPLRAARAPVDRFVQPTSVSRMLPAVLAFPFAFGFLFIASAVDAVAISLLPVVALDQGYSVEAGALFVTIFHVGLVGGQPVVGAALDTVGRRRAVLGCCLACLGCTAAFALDGRLGFWPAAFLMLVWGGANYGLYTAGLALIGDRFSGEALTAATAAFAAVYALASIVAPILAGHAIDSVGAAGLYQAITGIYLATLVVGAAFFRPLEPDRVTPQRCDP